MLGEPAAHVVEPALGGDLGAHVVDLDLAGHGGAQGLDRGELVRASLEQGLGAGRVDQHPALAQAHQAVLGLGQHVELLGRERLVAEGEVPVEAEHLRAAERAGPVVRHRVADPADGGARVERADQSVGPQHLDPVGAQQAGDAGAAELADLLGREGYRTLVEPAEHAREGRPGRGGGADQRPHPGSCARAEVVVVATPQVGDVDGRPGRVERLDLQAHVGHVALCVGGLPEGDHQLSAERARPDRCLLHERWRHRAARAAAATHALRVRHRVVLGLRGDGGRVDRERREEPPDLRLARRCVGTDGARGVLQLGRRGRVGRGQPPRGHEPQCEDRGRGPGPDRRVRVHRADALAQRTDGVVRRHLVLPVGGGEDEPRGGGVLGDHEVDRVAQQHAQVGGRGHPSSVPHAVGRRRRGPCAFSRPGARPCDPSRRRGSCG